MVTSANLGGLGAEEGQGISYEWSPPGFIGRALPFLAVLWPLCLRKNRAPQTLWLVPALIASLAFGWLITLTPAAIAPGELFLTLLNAAAFGFAAVWLLAPYLGLKGRFLAFLGTLLVMHLSGLFVIAVSRPWSDARERHLLMVRVAVFGALLVVALHLAGLSCRGRFAAGRLLVRIVCSVLACWVVALMIAAVGEPVGETAKLLPIWVLSSFAVAGPFLALSVCSDFFRERLKELLHLKEEESLNKEETGVTLQADSGCEL